MATIQNSPNPTPGFTPTPKKQPNRTPLFLGIIAVLVLALIGMGISYVQRGTENAELTQDMIDIEKVNTETEQQYHAAIAQLEEMAGNNEDLEALLDQQKEELRLQKEKISSLTRDSRNLAAARRELKELQNLSQGYVAELEELRAANAELAENNQRLTSERDLLSSDLQSSRQQNQELNSERAVLVSEREQLSATNQELNRKVGIASVLKANNVVVLGQKQRSSGKWVDRKSAKNVERMYVCFNSLENAVTAPGEESFELRLINPNGETIQIDAEGSGVFISEETGDAIPYTKSVNFAFDGSAASHCAEWNVASQQYGAGTYVAELYNKGFFVGSGTVTLR